MDRLSNVNQPYAVSPGSSNLYHFRMSKYGKEKIRQEISMSLCQLRKQPQQIEAVCLALSF